jgi:hypothetical protein
MGASAFNLVPALRPLHHAGSIIGSIGTSKEAWILLGAAAASVAIPVAVAADFGVSGLVLVLVGGAAFMFLMPLAIVTAGLYLEQS